MSRPLPSRARVCVLGDVMLGRRVADAAARDRGQRITAPVDERLAAADVVCGNLEAPLCRAPAAPGALRADPSAVAALHRFDVVSVANNHLLDCGDDGADETLETLRRAGIRYAGIGRDQAEALAPAVVSARGLRVGFVACVSEALLPSRRASRHALGALESPMLPTVVASARNEVDALVVAVHAGNEHVAFPPPSLRDRVRELCRAGADAVVTHHPHVVGGYERVGAALAWYGLGDFLFDGETDARRRGCIVTLEVGGGHVGGPDVTATHITERLQVVPAPAAVAARVHADVARVTRALQRPGYARAYPARYAEALIRAQVDAVRATHRRDGLDAALRAMLRRARFAPAHAAKVARGRFM